VTTVAQRRDCRVYVFEGWDPHTNYATKTVIYVGETGREPFERLMEHVYGKPWADTITGWRVLDEVYPDKTAVLVAEDATIKDLAPLYNYEGNLDNPRRVPIPEARRQRAARDRARGERQPWAPPADGRVKPSRRAAAATTRRQPGRRRSRRLVGFVVEAAAWVGLFATAGAAFWVIVGYLGVTATARSFDTVAGPIALFTAVWAESRPRRALTRPLAKFVAVTASIGVAVTLLPAGLHAVGQFLAALLT
jgi:hypothetical protein